MPALHLFFSHRRAGKHPSAPLSEVKGAPCIDVTLAQQLWVGPPSTFDDPKSTQLLYVWLKVTPSTFNPFVVFLNALLLLSTRESIPFALPTSTKEWYKWCHWLSSKVVLLSKRVKNLDQTTKKIILFLGFCPWQWFVECTDRIRQCFTGRLLSFLFRPYNQREK
jgi:hypothetical protein